MPMALIDTSRERKAWLYLVGEEGGKMVAAHNLKCILKVSIGFTRKTTDDICGNGQGRHLAAQWAITQARLASESVGPGVGAARGRRSAPLLHYM